MWHAKPKATSVADAVKGVESTATGFANAAIAKGLLDAKQVERARPKAKAYRLADGDGLYLFVPPSGAIAWQYRYRHA